MSDEDAFARARALLAAGDTAAATPIVERLAAAAPEAAQALHLEGMLHLARRDPAAAVKVLERAAAASPAEAAIHIDLGRALNNAGRLDAARAAFERAVALDPAAADARAYLGHALRGLGRLAAAEQSFADALARDPQHLRALKGLGSVRLARGDAPGAAAVLAEAVAIDPRDAAAAAHLGAARHRSGDPAGAEWAYRQALEADPDHVEAWLNLGITLQDTGRLSPAIEAYRQATRLEPRSLLAHNRLADALLATGLAGEALAATSSCLALDPGNPSALAARALALHELGRDRQAGLLLDYPQLVRSTDLVPPGAEPLAGFNAALREHVLAHPSLSYEPEGHATRGGRHTRDLLSGEKGPVAVLEAAVLEAATDYLRHLPLDRSHPFPGPVPGEPKLAMWAVVMDTEGHQLPHIHPAAWLSGVYYVDLPPTLGPDESDPAGWIEFGLPPSDVALRRTPPVALRRPVEGRMFLFPSYFYHRTIPFPGDKPRICIAFDILRRPAV
jgi:tetratricopeptide (TPR) repeat protein